MRGFAALFLALVAVACAESARDALGQAREALQRSRYAEAIEAADAGLAAQPDAVTSFGLESAKLEALARAGRGDETLAQLERLGSVWSEQAQAALYAATADQLRGATQGAAAIRALDLGLRRFPQDADLIAQIEAVKRAPAADGELDLLKSLGYVD